ncbi:arrestin domain-containing protein 3-like [Ptychodera flava]|uniref:arrestin domain-containing protein 3-like n=1 Tax=Ptychodera flava TaxID=63121 RepID=UPI00396A0BBE
MKVKVFRIEFENDKEVYRAGETITGWLLLEVEPRYKTAVRGFHVKFSGDACVKWREYVNEHYRKVVHEAYKTLFRHEITGYVGYESDFVHKTVVSMTGNEMPLTQNNRPPSVSGGKYRFPFHFKLPKTPLPASYEGKYGFVRYYVEARIDRTWKSEHYRVRGFSMAGPPVDLSKRIDIRSPVESGNEVEVAQGIMTLKTIHVKVQTDRSGYVPGEVLHYTVHVINHSRHRVKKMKAILVQLTSCYGHRRDSSKKLCLREEETELVKIKGPGLEAEVTRRIEGDIEIPPLPPTDLEGFDYINVKYYLEFIVKIANLAETVIKVNTPVLIGNIPSVEVYTWEPAPLKTVSIIQHDDLLSGDESDKKEESRCSGVPDESHEERLPPLRSRKPKDDDDIKEVITDLKVPYTPKHACYKTPREIQSKMEVFKVGEDSVRFFFMKYMPYKVARATVHKVAQQAK